MVEEILKMHKKNSDDNQDLVSTNGRALDDNLVLDKEAREYTKKVHKKNFEKKKEIDSKNEKMPE